MNKIFKNLTICLLTVSILISTTVSCKKEESTPMNEINTEEIGPQKFPWGVVIVAVCAVIVKVTEGQYYKETYPNGVIKEGCKGWGTCAMQVVMPPTGENGEIDVSSLHYYEQIDYTSEGVLGYDRDGHIVLALDNTPENRTSSNRFFYSEKISISRPLIIDNPEILKILDVSEKIIVQGDYAVQTYTERGEEAKYIIIK